jgi:hypothetical protein
MSVRKLEINQATSPLGQYVRELGSGPLLMTEDGHALAVLLPIDDTDLESLSHSLSPHFQAVIDQARAEYRAGRSLCPDEARRALETS